MRIRLARLADLSVHPYRCQASPLSTLLIDQCLFNESLVCKRQRLMWTTRKVPRKTRHRVRLFLKRIQTVARKSIFPKDSQPPERCFHAPKGDSGNERATSRLRRIRPRKHRTARRITAHPSGDSFISFPTISRLRVFGSSVEEALHSHNTTLHSH